LTSRIFVGIFVALASKVDLGIEGHGLGFKHQTGLGPLRDLALNSSLDLYSAVVSLPVEAYYYHVKGFLFPSGIFVNAHITSAAHMLPDMMCGLMLLHSKAVAISHSRH
jgi:hypothetical protein